jgi:alkylation response protein AidB-like acyl-CoA dehydrogenase
MLDALSFSMPPKSAVAETLRQEIRAFLEDELAHRSPLERAQSWNGTDPQFSRRLGARGWIGMTWPKRYGGAERSALERYVVIEELLAAGAPVAAHWIADRQSGPTLLRFGTQRQCLDILPRVARGECYFCIGMSEPDVGSDLAAVKTRAVRAEGGYRVSGTKLWTTNGHLAHYMILLARTDAAAAERHAGLSQFVIDLSTPGISIKPIFVPSGEHHFNEVIFDEVFVPADTLLGTEGDGWQQVMSELALERSGPERFLSSFTLFAELVRVCGSQPSERAALAIGRLASHLIILRRMSRSVAGALQSGQDPALQAAMVKDAGAVFEQEIPEIARSLIGTGSASGGDPHYAAVLAYTILHAPSFSLRGGTREILRGIIARGLGLR